MRLLLKIKPDSNYVKLVNKGVPKLEKFLDIVNVVKPVIDEHINLDDEEIEAVSFLKLQHITDISEFSKKQENEITSSLNINTLV